jgi:hypothetical protein
MRRAIPFAALALSLASAGVARADDAKSAQPPPEPEVEFVNRPYWGTVTELTRDSITIAKAERVLTTEQIAPDGTRRWLTVVQPAQPPRRFLVSAVLAAGGIPKDPRPVPGRRAYRVPEAYMYRLMDVKVGDWVYVMYARVDGVDICDHISIVKRPGGRVPPLPEGVETPPKLPPGWPERPWIRYHEGMNAYWDLEDRGIPYPEKFELAGRLRRFPVAPMPREVPIPKPRDGGN